MFALANFLPFRVALLSNRLTRRMAGLCRSFDVSGTEWRVIASLGEHGTLSSTELVEHAAIDRIRLHRVERRLRSRGYIKRQAVKADRGRVLFELKPRGREVYAKVAPLAQALQSHLLATTTEEERRIFERVLNAIETHASLAEGPGSERD